MILLKIPAALLLAGLLLVGCTDALTGLELLDGESEPVDKEVATKDSQPEPKALESDPVEAETVIEAQVEPAEPVDGEAKDQTVEELPAEPKTEMEAAEKPQQAESDVIVDEPDEELTKTKNLEEESAEELPAEPRNPARVGFAIEFDGLINDWPLMTASLLPDRTFKFKAVEPGDYKVTAEKGIIEKVAENSWEWKAPDKPGFYPIEIAAKGFDKVMTLNMAVERWWDGKYNLNNHRIGTYPKELFKNLPTYVNPYGFIEVTADNEDTRVSPHFQLKQFLSKQQNTYPKYILLKPSLLMKLELLVEKLEDKGYQVGDTIYVHSGFRTPAYNFEIGNRSYNSRHCYGDAADIYIDADGDKLLDDLNNDGWVGNPDIDIVFDAVNELLTEPWHEKLIGGVGYYVNRSYRGPFIHIDTRGYEYYWGKPKPDNLPGGVISKTLEEFQSGVSLRPKKG